MPRDNSWEIVIDRFDGFVPGFWRNANPTYGNKTHASDLQNIDLFDPSVLTQGPGLANLTDGTQAGAITTLLKGIQKISVAGTYAYGVGGAKLQRFTATAVSNTGDWPHTIDKATVTGEDGEDVCYYDGNTYYSYNHSGNTGDIGQYNGTAFDDDYISTVPTNATALQGGVPHQMIVGGDNVMYVANGRYIAKLDGTTFTDQALDFPEASVVVSLAWENNRVYAAVNRPNLSTSTYQESSIYIWDTTSSSWEYQIRIPGKIGALFTRLGIVYVFYKDLTDTGGYHLGYVNGNQINDLASFTGSLPEYYQVVDHAGHLLWISSGEVWAWGAVEQKIPLKLFQYADAGYATAGGITNAFGTPMVASTDGVTNFRFAKFSGYDVNATYKSILLDVSSARFTSFLERVVVYTEPMSTGARLDVTLTTNYGGGSDSTLDNIAYDATNTTKTRHIIQRNGSEVETIRLDLNWANGSATNPVKVRKIVLAGRYHTDQ